MTSGLLKCFAAANCILHKGSTEKLLLYHILAIFGAHDLDSPYETGRLALSPKKATIHNDWNPYVENFDADISLLEFKEGQININFAYINPICIWNDSETPLPSGGVVLGWGRSENENKIHENVPKLHRIPNMLYCFSEKRGILDLSSRRTFCAGLRNNSGTGGNNSGVCHGYSGSGLVIEIHGIYYLKGLVSSTLIKESSCETSKPFVYTDVWQFMDWIQEKTAGAFATKGD